jgi:hypothetical protein
MSPLCLFLGQICMETRFPSQLRQLLSSFSRRLHKVQSCQELCKELWVLAAGPDSARY